MTCRDERSKWTTWEKDQREMEDQPFFQQKSSGTDFHQLDEFLDSGIRLQFARKVYGILSSMLLLTFGVSSFVVLYRPVSVWLLSHPILLGSIGFVPLVGCLVVACCDRMLRRPPLNYILLFTISLAYGIIISAASSVKHTKLFFLAMGATASIVVMLTIFAYFTKLDVTRFYMFGLVMALVLVGFGILSMVMQNPGLHLVYAALGTLMGCFYIVFNTQMIFGGKHRRLAFSTDDSVFAVLVLYLDIITLFLFLRDMMEMASR